MKYINLQLNLISQTITFCAELPDDPNSAILVAIAQMAQMVQVALLRNKGTGRIKRKTSE